MSDLAALPRDHALRNSPLAEIAAEYRWTGSAVGKGWHQVGPTWRIARATFNDLGPAWMRCTEWRARHD